jgi:hypothetical protein
VVEFDQNLRVAIVWPYFKGDITEVYNTLGDHLVSSKELDLNINGINNLCVLAYETEQWLGNIQNIWQGSYSKSIGCFAQGGTTHCILYNSSGEKKDLEIKSIIRNLNDGSKHNIHSSDNHEETQKLFLTCYCKDTETLLNNLDLNKLAKYFDHINKELAKVNRYVFVGSSTLEVLGIREAQDIDIIVSQDDSLKIDSHNIYSCYYPKPLELYLYLNLSVFNYMGLKFLPLSDLIKMKTKRGEYKDKLDILASGLVISKVKSSYLHQKKIKLLLSAKRNYIKYKTISTKKLKTVLIFLGVFPFIKRIINRDK